MCGSKQNPWLLGLGMLLAVLVVYGGRAQADISSDRAGSIIIFPKVIADATRNTIIQIANTGNTPVYAHCLYISEYDAPSNSCDHIDFDIHLTKQQPTVWLASVGRNGSLTDGFPPNVGGPASFDPPPLIYPRAQLMCVQIDAGGVPATGNQLKGEAIIYNVENPQKPYSISEYNAISIAAGSSAGSNVLDFSLVGTTTGTGYNACPDNLIMNHYAPGAVDGFTNGTASTELTLVPCSLLLEESQPVPATAVFATWDEFEVAFSKTVPFQCLLNISLDDPRFFGAFAFGTYFKTRIRPGSAATGSVCYTGQSFDGIPDLPSFPLGHPIPGNTCTTTSDCVGNSGVCVPDVAVAQVCHSDGDCGGGTCQILGCMQPPGLLGVAEEFQTPIGPSGSTGPTASAAANLFTEGARPGDVMVLPAGAVPGN